MAPGYDKEGEGEVYEQYEPYSSFREKGLMGKPFLTYVVVGAGALVAALLLFFFFSGSDNGEAAQRVVELERRLDDLEFRIAEVEAYRSRLDMLESKGPGTDDLRQRVVRLEGSVAEHMNKLDQKVAALEKKAAGQPVQTSPRKASATAGAVKKPSTAKAASGARYHVVQAGETLYSISRQYKTSVDTLRQLNKIGTDFTIRPGQKIQVPN